MTETRKKVSLDAALGGWPADAPPREKPALDWEVLAQSIDARIASDEAGSGHDYISDEILLAAPLGQIEGEGHNSAAQLNTSETPRNDASKGKAMTMPADRERDRRSLQDLAKMATQGMTPPPPSVSLPSAPMSAPQSAVQRAAEATKDDSGIVDLAMAAQSDPQGAVRAQTTPLASDGLFDDEPASIRPPPMSSSAASLAAPLAMPSQPMPSMPPASIAPTSAVPASAVASARLPSEETKKGKGGVLVLLFVGVAAVAAGGFFFVQHQRAGAAQAVLKTEVAPPPVVVAAAPAPKPAEVTAPAPEATLDPNALPSEPDPIALAAKPTVGGRVVTPGAKTDKPVAAAKEETAKLSQKDLPTAPSGPQGDLGKAMGAAVGADGKPIEATPAAGNTAQFAAGSVPQKPSQGAVTGAIGAVLPGARACLGPDDAVSRASITFGSAGGVSSVSVSGGAAGKPAEGCIKAALGKAKVAPFAEPTYTANVTVRH